MPDDININQTKLKRLEELITTPEITNEAALRFLNELELDDITQYFWTHDERTAKPFAAIDAAFDELTSLSRMLHEEEFKSAKPYLKNGDVPAGVEFCLDSIRAWETDAITSNTSKIVKHFHQFRPELFELLSLIIENKFNITIRIPEERKERILAVIQQQPSLWKTGLLASLSPEKKFTPKEKEDIANGIRLRVKNFICFYDLIRQTLQQETLLLCQRNQLFSIMPAEEFRQRICEIRSTLLSAIITLDDCVDTMLYDFHFMIPELRGEVFYDICYRQGLGNAEKILNEILRSWICWS